MFWKKSPAPPEKNPQDDGGGVRSPESGSASKENVPPLEDAPSLNVPETDATPDAPAGPREEIATGLLREQIIGQLRTVYDPEIPVNIYELGLVYKVHVDEERNVLIEMTLTSPACPSAEEIPVDVRRKTEAIEGVKSVDVRIVWDPPWSQEFMSEAAKVQLGFF
jgi:FeS assembly SUF system protein